MTYKHIQFSDSPTMRSLERVARDKGLFRSEESISKVAHVKKTDLTPTASLLENVLKLCTGLRQRGFDKHAEQLEANVLNYKRAQTLYETSKEKGEDLVHAAHPKGSHKLEGVEAQEDGAVFEDILDQYAKTIQMINKKPTGKLASINAIKAVKIVLADDNLDKLYVNASDTLNKFREVYTSIATMMGDSADENADYFSLLQSLLAKKKVSSSKTFATSLLSMIDNMKSDMEPSYLSTSHSAFSPQQEGKWQNVQKYFPILKKYADRFRQVVEQIKTIEGGAQNRVDTEEAAKLDPEVSPTAPVAIKSNPLIDRLQVLLGKLQAAMAIKAVANSPTASKWVASEVAEIKQQMQRVNSVPANQSGTISSALENDVAGYENEVDQFYTTWVNGRRA